MRTYNCERFPNQSARVASCCKVCAAPSPVIPMGTLQGNFKVPHLFASMRHL